jgi:hypothetical protein
VTLAVGAKYPWGSLRKLTAIQRNLPQAVLFVTDSRWTKYYPNNDYEFENVGTKLFSLTSDSAIVYSGDVIAAEHCITQLKNELQKIRNKNFTTSLYTSQQTFRKTYSFHKKSRKTRLFPLFFLIGTCDKTSKANLIYFRSPKFSPIFIEGMYGIGLREAYKDLETVVNQQVDKAVKEEFDTRSRFPIPQLLPSLPVQTQAEHAGMLIVAAMQGTIFKGTKYETIGSPMQFAMVDKDGVRMPEAAWTTDGTGATDTWHRETARPDEITTYQEKYKLGPAFTSANGFKLYSISD